MPDKTMEDALVIGLVGFGIWELHQAYSRVAPPIPILRATDRDDTACRQSLLDADMHVGGLALFGGAVASFLLRSWWPIVIVGAAFAYTSWCHHDVLKGPTPTDIDSIVKGANQEWALKPTQ